MSAMHFERIIKSTRKLIELERLNQRHTRESMVSPSLHVERGKVECQLFGEFKKSLSQLIVHHVILGVQLCPAAHQTSQDGVQTT